MRNSTDNHQLLMTEFPHKDKYLLGFTDSYKDDGTILFISKKTEKHLLSIAPTRTGKGRSLILPNLLNLPDHSIFVIDPKGENALVSARYRQRQGHEIIIFNPYGIHADAFEEHGFTQFKSFNPLKNLDIDSPTFADDVAIIADAMIYDSGSGRDSHWTDAARGLVEFLIMYLIAEPTEDKTFDRLRAIIAGGHAGFMREDDPNQSDDINDNRNFKTVMNQDLIDENRRGQHESQEARVKISIFEKAIGSKLYLVSDNAYRYAHSNNEVSGVFATAEVQTRILKSEIICSALNGKSFDFEQMKHKKITVYFILPTEHLITKVRYLRLVLLIAMSQFMRSEKGSHQVLMMLDEFANLGPLQVIENGYGLIAGHGVTLWSFVQNLTQLQNIYPKNWETFLANSSVVTVSNVNDVTTAEYFSRRAAKQLNLKTSIGQGNNVNYNGLNMPSYSYSYQNNNSWDMQDSLPVANLYKTYPGSIYLYVEGHAMPILVGKLLYDVDSPFMEEAEKNPMIVGKPFLDVEAGFCICKMQNGKYKLDRLWPLYSSYNR